MQGIAKDVEEPNENKVPEASVSSEVNDKKSSDNICQPPYRPPPPVQLNQDFSILNNIIQERQDAALKNSLMDITPSECNESLIPSVEDVPPKVHPRRKSSTDKSITEKRSSIGQLGPRTSIPNQEMVEMDETLSSTLSSSVSESMLLDSEQKISVKERKQMFNRMASESDVLRTNKVGGNVGSPQVSICGLFFIHIHSQPILSIKVHERKSC